MKKTFIGFTAAALVLSFNFQALTSSSTPPARYTGAPGESNCTSCHNGAVNLGSGSAALTGAPATYVGPVTFYIAGNAANGNGNDTGDNIYTTSMVLNQAAAPTGLKEDQNTFVSVFPNPATETLHLNFVGKASAVKVLDMTGREV